MDHLHLILGIAQSAGSGTDRTAGTDQRTGAMEQTSLSIDPAYIGHLKGEVDIESVVSVIEKIFVPNHFPTAIFCCSDEVAIELMCWLMHHGYKIPEDVSVLSLDGKHYSEKLKTKITTI